MTHTIPFLNALLLAPLAALHAAGPGYTRWMKAMGPTLEKLLNERP